MGTGIIFKPTGRFFSIYTFRISTLPSTSFTRYSILFEFTLKSAFIRVFTYPVYGIILNYLVGL